MTKRAKKASIELMKKVWDKFDNGERAVISYKTFDGFEKTENVKYVRWDGAIVTESGDFIFGDLEEITAVA